MSFGRLGSLGRGFGRLGSGGRGGSVIVPGVIAAGAGSYVWTGQDASLVIAETASLAADAGSYLWTGDDMTALRDIFVSAEAGSYAWTGQDATLTYSGGASYEGPGDIVSSAVAWYGLRAYNAAYATGSNPALDLVDQAGGNALTVNILSDGRLDVASISSWVTANSVTTIKVTRWYDQSGNTRHVNQATLSKMPVLNLTGFGSLPAVVFTASGSMELVSSSITQAQPITASVVYTRGSASGQIVSSVGGSNCFVRTASGATVLNAGTDTGNVGTAANGSWHAIQAVLNSSSSAVYIDGTATTGLNAGTNGYSATTIGIGSGTVVAFFDGSMAEVGLWGSAFTTSGGGQADLINTNQHGTDGYNF